MFTAVDWAIIGLLGLSTLISLFRGFIREALSLVIWVVAIWVSLTFSGVVGELLSGRIETPSVRTMLAFTGLFVLTLMVGAMLSFLVSKLVKSTGFSGTDRLLGVFFGLARGAALMVGFVLVAGLTALPADPWWQASQLMPYFETLAGEARTMLPDSVSQYIDWTLPADVSETGVPAMLELPAETSRSPDPPSQPMPST